jgi:CheY-like chemotaxis protein
MTTETERTALAGLRVLVVEDELVIAMLLEDMLEELDANVVGPVKSPEDAVSAITSEPPDAATLDVNMGGRRSYAAAAALRARSIPFVFVTGYSKIPDCPHEFRNVPKLTKPFRLSELASVLETALAQAQTPP